MTTLVVIAIAAGLIKEIINILSAARFEFYISSALNFGVNSDTVHVASEYKTLYLIHTYLQSTPVGV